MEYVSIVIPIYNAEKYLAFCLDSVLRQTHEHLEVILVDDGSTDASGAICDNYAKMDSRIVVYHRKNAGVSASRNFGLEHASGTYLLCVDADDALEPDMIEGCVEIAKRNQAELVICSFRYHMMDTGQIVENRLGSEFAGSEAEFFNHWFTVLLEKEILNPPWNKFIKKELLDMNHIRFHQSFSICEDMAFSMQLLIASKKTVLTGKMYYNYYLKSDGTLVFKFHENYFEALTYFYEFGLRYCQSFKEHKRQLRCLNTLYVNRIIVFLKQIITESQWDKKARYQAMSNIRSNQRFLAALPCASLSCKKRLVCYFLRKGQYGLVHMLYQLKRIRIGWLEKEGHDVSKRKVKESKV